MTTALRRFRSVSGHVTTMLATLAACIGNLADALRVARKALADDAWRRDLRRRSVTPPIRSRRA
jgi:hypothetical protein